MNAIVEQSYLLERVNSYGGMELAYSVCSCSWFEAGMVCGTKCGFSLEEAESFEAWAVYIAAKSLIFSKNMEIERDRWERVLLW